MPGNTAYCLSKGGMRMLTRTAGVELAPHNILVVGVGPGAVDTPINKATVADPKATGHPRRRHPPGPTGRARGDRQRRGLPRRGRRELHHRHHHLRRRRASCSPAPGSELPPSGEGGGPARRCTEYGSPLRPRPGHGGQRVHPCRRPGRHHPAGRGGREARLPPDVGGRAPRHAGGGQFGPGRAHRPPGRRHHHPADRGRWGHAAQPFALADHRRAVRHPRGPAPGADRPRPGPGSRAPTRPRPAPCAGTADQGADTFPQDVVELINYLVASDGPVSRPAPVPGRGYLPEVWLLGSSTFSAQLAGLLGLPFSFAYHFSPARSTRPWSSTGRLPSVLRSWTCPHFMVAVSVLCAPTEEEARWLARDLRP
jgi:hypothetical protein